MTSGFEEPPSSIPGIPWFMAPPYSTVLFQNGDDEEAPDRGRAAPEPETESESESDDEDGEEDEEAGQASRMTCALGQCCAVTIEDDGREADLCDWFVFSALMGMALLTVLTVAVVVGILLCHPDPHGIAGYFVDFDEGKPCPHGGAGPPPPDPSPFREVYRQDYYRRGGASGDVVFLEAIADRRAAPPRDQEEIVLELSSANVLKILMHVCLGLMFTCGVIYTAVEALRVLVPSLARSCRAGRGRRRSRRHGRRCRRCRERGRV